MHGTSAWMETKTEETEETEETTKGKLVETRVGSQYN